MSGALVAITDSDLPSNRIEEVLLDGAGLRAVRADCTTEDEVIERCQGAEALIVQWVPIGERALDALPTVRFISRLGIGYDMIDVDAATARGVAVANTPDYCIDEVVCHTLALILDRLRSISTLDRAVREGRWTAVADAPRAVRPDATTVAVIDAACALARVHRLQLWDCVVCAASMQAGAKVLLTEDMQDGRTLDSLRLINPFHAGNLATIESLLGG